ncbi:MULTISPECIES: polysaccharide biosynthesis tyrosine autokinase [unclassified Nostoc]|uniref:GumC family protein n=1 Tax=unclassified Nostoc TaxID=2593658 RepID=UPI002AD22B8B|nr:polysaccharide biosynthesis tyrosine autokinase [Nostoc sp. DedQUE03]MDZ7973529.1 polysaccharide biosynthesis tyrosine autokinase [Nostoc sp. DedQUE03]MDZ8047232.1 polysaccharide biosynthesis tyrosine autokinase [Nostoc sp. DedQUE02]
MENSSSQSSSSDRSNNSVPPFPQNQLVPWAEEQEEGWNFQEFLSLLQRRSLVMAGVTIAVMIIVVISLVLNRKPPEYEGTFQLLVEPVNDDTKAVDVVKDPNSQKSSLDYESQIQVLKSPELMRSTLKQLQASYPEINYYTLLQSLKITRLGETKIIQVLYQSNNPKKTQFVLERIADNYLDYSQVRRQTKLRQGLQFVEKELPVTQNRVDKLQKELQIFRQKYNFNDPETQEAEIGSQTVEFSKQKQAIDLQLAQARANLAILKEKNGATTILNNDPLYQQLIAQIRQLDIQIATESTRLQKENPTIQTLKEKRASLLPVLRQESQRLLGVKFAELATQLQTLEIQSQELIKTERELAQRRNQLPVLTRQYTELQRKLQFANENLNRFLSTRENLQIQISQTELGWQLLQAPTTPEVPVSSFNTGRNLILGIIASLLAGIGVVLLIDKLENTYHSVDELKTKIKQPLLGNIPFEKQVQTNKPNHALNQTISLANIQNYFSQAIANLSVLPNQEDGDSSTNFSEALRVLYTNIQLLSSDRPIRSIVMSSAMSGDGKSTVALHLAQIATAMGQRVLLVDADLRKPQIHDLSNLNNLRGLSNLISTNLQMGEVMRQLPSMNQLSIITAGPIPPDPTKLLSSQKMKQLMADFHNSFDLVIYDVPPLVGLADASLIAPHTDGLLIVVRIHKTNTSMLKAALDNLKISRLNILGIVGNGQQSTIKSYYQ